MQSYIHIKNWKLEIRGEKFCKFKISQVEQRVTHTLETWRKKIGRGEWKIKPIFDTWAWLHCLHFGCNSGSTTFDDFVEIYHRGDSNKLHYEYNKTRWFDTENMKMQRVPRKISEMKLLLWHLSRSHSSFPYCRAHLLQQETRAR